jgi:hypothetical protein
MFLSFSDSKTETSKEILLKGFLKKTFNFRFPTTQYSLDGGDERAILERRDPVPLWKASSGKR